MIEVDHLTKPFGPVPAERVFPPHGSEGRLGWRSELWFTEKEPSTSYDAKPEGHSRVYELSCDFVHSLPKPEKEKKASKGES
jgi:hypothetical protein